MNRPILATLVLAVGALTAGSCFAQAGPTRLGAGTTAKEIVGRLSAPAPVAAAEDDSTASLLSTRGIIPRNAAPTAVVERAATAGSSMPQKPPSIALDVKFEYNSADLTAEARQLVGELAAALKSDALAAQRFRLEGHTDATGPRKYNIVLSGRRADAVRTYLAELGVPAERIEA